MPFLGVFNTNRSGVLTVLFGCCMAGATWNCCRLRASSVYTIQLCTSVQCHFIQNHIGRVHLCLAATCHLHFGKNDWDLLHATAVTRSWNKYQNKSTERWVRSRNFSRCSCRNLNRGPFDHESGILPLSYLHSPLCALITIHPPTHPPTLTHHFLHSLTAAQLWEFCSQFKSPT